MEESECVGGGLSSPEKLVKEHFIVDELLDFPKDDDDDDDDKVLFTVGDENVFDSEPVNSSESSTVATADAGSANSNLASDDACPNFLYGDLCEPYEELAELEWLSNFVEESFSSEDLEKLHLISGTKVQTEAQTNGNTKHSTPEEPGLFLPEAPVPGKARSKRSRAAASAWSSSLLVLSPSTSTSCDSELLVPNNGNATKKQGKKRRETPEKPGLAASDGRKCLHCATDRTPQWRTGPLGPKTLCNACGVRYKSGRLVPEYRPAASPTFVLSKHSNSHRKVIELRRQKDMRQQQEQTAGAGAGDEFLVDHRIGLEI
ncbi:putative transcription factor C2C2-GATA family [Dioscorea sansibarensis]